MTNIERAERAERAIKHSKNRSSGDLESDFQDLLSNMMHLANQRGFDFDLALDLAREHYLYEINPDNEDAED